jgi:hypothetical protein
LSLFHQEEIPLLDKEYEEYSKVDKEWWAEQETERVSELKVEREDSLGHQKRLARMGQVSQVISSHIVFGHAICHVFGRSRR